jgi:hypothetical protein
VPGPLRDRQVAMIDGAYLGDPDDGDTALAPLRALRPEIDTHARLREVKAQVDRRSLIDTNHPIEP